MTRRPNLIARRLLRALNLPRAAALILGLAFAGPIAVAPETATAQDDWGAERGDLRAKKIERYKALVNKSDEEGYAFKQLMKTVGKGADYDKLVAEYRAKVDKDPANYRWHMLLGHMLRYGNNLELALAEYEAAIAIERTALGLESVARVHDANKSMDLAVENYEAALAVSKDREQQERILRSLGSMAIHRRKLEDAQGYFDRLVELDPKNIYLRKELSQLLIENKLYDEALVQLRAAEKIAGKNVQVRAQISLDIGDVLEKQGKDDEAIKVYRAAAKKTSDGSWFRTVVEERVIGIYRRQNKLHELVAYYEETWKAPTFEELMILSQLHGELGDEGKALEYARKAIKKRPRDADARQRLVQLLERTGDIEQVIAAYEDMIKALPTEPRFRFELADLLFRSQQKEKAVKVLEKTGKSFGRSAEVHVKLADRYLMWDMREKALAEYKLLVKLEPNEPAHLENLGEYYFQTGKRDEALATWKKVLKVVSDPVEARMHLGRIYGDHGMVEEAVAEYLIAAEKAPENLQVQRDLGELYERARRHSDAIETWEGVLAKTEDKMMRREARQHIIAILHTQGTLRTNLNSVYAGRFRRDPPDVEAGYFLAEGYLKLKDLPEATKVLERLLEIKPDDLEALVAIEKAYSDLGEYEKAIAVLEKLAEVDATRARVYYQKIADSYLKVGDPDAAEEWMVATLELNANDSRSYAKLGDVYRKKRQFSKAAEMYEEAINVDSRAYDHYFVLADLYGQLHRDADADKLLRIIVQNAIDETMVLKAARRTIDYNQFQGTMESLEQDFLPLMHKTPRRPVYNKILLELYVAMTQDPIAKARSGAPDTRELARRELESIGRRAIKPLLDALASDDAIAQRIALDLLGEIGNPNAALQLSLLAESKNSNIALRSVLALGRIGHERAVDGLAKAAGSASSERRIRELATWGLGRTGSPLAVSALKTRAAGSLNNVRALAALGLGRTGGGVEDVRRLMREDSAHSVRAAAAWAAGALEDKDSVELLVDMIREERDEVAAMAAWSLGALGDKSTIEPLLEAYWGGTPRVREAAGFALVRLASNERVVTDSFSLWEENAAFIDLGADTGFDMDGLLEEILVVETRSLKGHGGDVAIAFEAELSSAARRWLAADDGTRISTVLRDLDGTAGSLRLPTVVDTNDEASAMARVVTNVAPELRRLLSAPIAEHRWHAVSLLGKIADQEASATLVEMMKSDPAPDVRRQAALALGRLGDSGAYPALFESLQDEYFGVRAHAAWAIGLLGDGRAYEAVADMLDDEYAYVAAMAARALGLLGDARAVETLLAAAAGAPASVQTEIVLALGALGAADRAKEFESSPHRSVRDALRSVSPK